MRRKAKRVVKIGESEQRERKRDDDDKTTTTITTNDLYQKDKN